MIKLEGGGVAGLDSGKIYEQEPVAADLTNTLCNLRQIHFVILEKYIDKGGVARLDSGAYMTTFPPFRGCNVVAADLTNFLPLCLHGSHSSDINSTDTKHFFPDLTVQN